MPKRIKPFNFFIQDKFESLYQEKRILENKAINGPHENKYFFYL